MELTKQQRQDIYKKCLEEVKLGDYWICVTFQSILREYGVYTYHSEEIINYLPEFSLFKPEEKYIDDAGGWWDKTEKGNKERQIVLEFCIEMTK